MPRGKYLRKNKRNESALITRLMQISLNMDDHIYYGKRITASQAGAFLQEIATLKLKCLPTNVRAHQVIEKLTRCMKSILAEEDTGPRSYSFNASLINSENTGSISPVYSLPHEDRNIDIDVQNDIEVPNSPGYIRTVDKQINSAHTSQGVVNVTIPNRPGNIRTVNEKINSAHTSQGVVNVTIPNRSGNIRTVNEKINSAHTSQGVVNVTIPNRSGNIRTVNEKINSAHTSQGVVNVTLEPKDHENITPVLSVAQNIPHHKTETKNYIEVIDITNDSDTDETNIIPPVSNEQDSSIVHLNSGISMLTIQDGFVAQTKADDCSQSILDDFNNDKVNKVADSEKNHVDETHHILDANINDTSTVVNNLDTQALLTNTALSTPITAIAPSKLGPINSQTRYANSESVSEGKPKLMEKKIKRAKKKGKGKKNDVSVKDNPKPKSNTMITKDVANTTANSSKVNNKPKKSTKKTHEIYNNNVENDLSWVENLRFVREISADEYDPGLALLEDNFWDNFALPETWNDSEFD